MEALVADPAEYILIDSSSTIEEVKNFKCPECLKPFRSETYLRRHIWAHKRKESKIVDYYYCTKCDEKSSDYRKMFLHIKSHTESLMKAESSTKAKSLTEKSPTEKSSTEIPVTEGIIIERFECGKCHKFFGSKTELDRHNSLRYAKELKCQICGNTLKDKYEFNIHMDLHKENIKSLNDSLIKEPSKDGLVTRERFECVKCRRFFGSRVDLDTHNRLHYAKRLKCKICGKSYDNTQADKSELVIHMKTHKDKCDSCGLRFKSVKELAEHMYEESHGQTFVCKICNEPFLFNHECESHLLNSHNILLNKNTYTLINLL